MARQTELRLSYSIGTKINTGNFENQDMHVSQSETWTFDENENIDIVSFSEERHSILKNILEARLEKEVAELVDSMSR